MESENKPEDTHIYSSDEKHPVNAGKISSWNVSESGGGEIRNISRMDRSSSNSPFRSELISTLSPKEMKPVFGIIKEVKLAYNF